MKNFVSIILLSLTLNFVFAGDTISVKAKVVIGPPELVLPPPIDSVKLIRLSVFERLKKTNSEHLDFLNHKNMARVYSTLSKTGISEAPDEDQIQTLEETLPAYKKSGDLKGEALVYTTYGVYYSHNNQPDKAIYFFTEAMKLKERLNDEAGAISIAESLSALYKLKGQYGLALRFAQYVVEGNLHRKSPTLNARTYLDISSMKFMQSKYRESEYYILRKAFPLYQRTGNKWGRMLCFQNLAELYLKQERFGEAKWFYIQAQIMAAKLSDNQSIITSLTGLAKVKNALGEYDEALKDYKKAQQLARNNNNYLSNLVEINAGLGEMYSNIGDYRSASAALDEYTKVRTSWLQINKL